MLFCEHLAASWKAPAQDGSTHRDWWGSQGDRSEWPFTRCSLGAKSALGSSSWMDRKTGNQHFKDNEGPREWAAMTLKSYAKGNKQRNFPQSRWTSGTLHCPLPTHWWGTCHAADSIRHWEHGDDRRTILGTQKLTVLQRAIYASKYITV